MPTNPYEPPKEVARPARRPGWIPALFNALGFAASMIAGACLGVPFFVGPSSSQPLENVQQLATGLIVGAIVGGIAYKVLPKMVRRR